MSMKMKDGVEEAQASSRSAAAVRQGESGARAMTDNRESARLQRKLIDGIAQRASVDDEEDAAVQTKAAPTANKTGMPDNLKSGIESLSGMDMSAVRVHRNSSKPAQLNALAYAQGNDIHLGAGQEKHLPHEAWHVVQQRQGRVRPTMQMAGVQINDDASLESEADVMGGRALTQRKVATANPTIGSHIDSEALQMQSVAQLGKSKYPYGGPDSVPHVETYGGGAHLKIVDRGGIKRYNIIKGGRRHAQANTALAAAAGNDTLVGVINDILSQY